MRKICSLFALMSLLALVAQSQTPSQKTGSSSYRPGTESTPMTDIRERLVQLALQNPQFEIADRKVAIADYQLKIAKNDWLSVIQPQVNINPLTLQTEGNTTNTNGNNERVNLFPIYNIAIGIPLNFFGQRINTIKTARQNLLISEAEKNEQYRKIRTAVLTKYEDYIMYKAKLERQSRITQDAYLNYKQKEKDFQDGLIMIEDYNKSFQTYSEQQDLKDQAQRNLNVTKIELEEMIGGSLDDVIGKK